MDRKDLHTELAAMFRSFAHPTRIAIVEKLARQGTCMNGEVVPVEDLAEATVAEHLRCMRNEGVIKGRLGRNDRCYCLDWERLDHFKALFDRFYDQVRQRQDNAMCEYKNGK